MRTIMAHVKERQQFGRPLADFELIKEKIAHSTLNIFVSEAMVYMTTGLIDRGDVDYSLESAMSKVFATDALWDNMNEALQMAGGIGYSKEYPYEQYLRDARINPIFEGTNEILRVFVALSGMQERGEYLKKIGKALKGPIKGFGLLTDFAVQYMKERLTTERIREVHTSLANSREQFENWAKNLHVTTERALMKYGSSIIKRQMIQKRLADAMMHLYGMIATISYVDSKINKDGADKCQLEIEMCNTYCNYAWRIVRRNILMVDKNPDRHLLNIAAATTEEGGYPL